VDGDGQPRVTFVTLGPEGTCHERAVQEYARFQGVEDYAVELITDFFAGLEMIRGRDDAFLVQCSFYSKDPEITENGGTVSCSDMSGSGG